MLPIALALIALPVPPSEGEPIDADADAVDPGFGTPLVYDVVGERRFCMSPAPPREQSKKGAWLAEKARRPNVHLADADLGATRGRSTPGKGKAKIDPRLRKDADPLDLPAPRPGSRIEPVTTLYNVWTHEALPLLPGDRDGVESRFHGFVRDHFTNQATRMDVRLVSVLAKVAQRFSASRIEVVSGYRSPKYNLMLRKKGHQVARESQHVEGNAVDFRVRGVPTKTMLNFVKSLRLGGVGFYPRSAFVHSDTGRVRYWTGS